MDTTRPNATDFDLARALDDVEAGATVEVTRDGRPVATLPPVAPDPDHRKGPAPHPSWKEAGVDWDEVRRFTTTLPFHPTNSVEEMCREVRLRPRIGGAGRRRPGRAPAVAPLTI